MAQPTGIYEVVYNDSSVVDQTRTTHLLSGECFWTSRNLPSSGKSALDSTIGSNNCECVQYVFTGHGAGNYVTNFKYYIASINAVASDMTHFMRTGSTFTAPSTYTDSNIYGFEADWSETPISVPASSNITTGDGFTETSDPTRTEFVYNAVIVESLKTTGTAQWATTLLYQYT